MIIPAEWVEHLASHITLLAATGFGGLVGLPELAGYLLHIGVVAHGPGWTAQGDRPQIALTFDDGPDPRYTPHLLRYLREEGVPASFFLVGKRAVRAPELVQQMAAEGHTIGNHTYSHRHGWLLKPAQVQEEVERGAEVLDEILRRPVRYFRPPWGGFSWRTWRAAQATHATLVLWSVMGYDWSHRSTVRSVMGHVLAGIDPGAIVLLHDAGGAPEAPSVTLRAVPLLVNHLRREGYQLVSLDQMLATPARSVAVPRWVQPERPRA